MNQSSVSRTARPPLKILKDFWRLVHIFLNLFGQWFPKEWDFFPKDFQNLWLQIFEASIIICHLKINLIRKQSFVAALLFFAICFFRVYEKEKNSMKYFFKLDFQIVFYLCPCLWWILKEFICICEEGQKDDSCTNSEAWLLR